MFRTMLVAVGVVGLLAGDLAAVQKQPQASPAPLVTPTDGEGYCCKICTKGKACGDSCIARWKTCHVGPGCACDAWG